MQKYLQSLTNRIEQMRVRREDAERWEQWMSKRMLPEDLRERIRRYEQYKWQETRGVEEESLFCKLPKDIRRDIKRHLYLAFLCRVPMFEIMGEQLLEEMCDHLKSVLYTENSYIIREGHPIEAMLFIMRGTVLSTVTNGGKTGIFNSVCLNVGDFCGEEILPWALDPHSSSPLPLSSRTVKVLTSVEAFALTADDLKLVVSQLRRIRGNQLRHTFRFYSAQWRTWAACYIQAAWRKYCCRKLEKSLHEEEGRLQDAVADVGNSSPNLGVTLYASMFAANLLQHKRAHNELSLRPPSPSLLLKPDEPDLSNYDH